MDRSDYVHSYACQTFTHSHSQYGGIEVHDVGINGDEKNTLKMGKTVFNKNFWSTLWCQVLRLQKVVFLFFHNSSGIGKKFEFFFSFGLPHPLVMQIVFDKNQEICLSFR